MSDFKEVLKLATDTRAIMVEERAMDKVPELLKSLFGYTKKYVVVTDTNTHAVAGERLQEIIKEAGLGLEKGFIFADPHLFAEWGFYERLFAYLQSVDAIAIAVGSGVINDLTKLSSHRLGRPYIIIGTAASMDGYTAYGASITFEGNKQTFDCKAPIAAVIDPIIAAAAPKGMSASGYADLYAKIPAGADWMIADALGVEKIHPFAFHQVQDSLRHSLSDPSGVASGAVEPTALLCEGLIMSGLAMQACKSSRPASGTEHQFSHYWDMEGLCFEGKHVSHGFKVAIGTLVSTAILEYLIDFDFNTLDIDAAAALWPTWEQQQDDIREVLGDRPSHIERALSESKAKYVDAAAVKAQLELLKELWPTLREKVKAQITPFSEVLDAFKAAGAPYMPEMIGISREHLRETFYGIPYMRSRFTGIDILHRAGLMGEVDTLLFGKGGIWEI